MEMRLKKRNGETFTEIKVARKDKEAEKKFLCRYVPDQTTPTRVSARYLYYECAGDLLNHAHQIT